MTPDQAEDLGELLCRTRRANHFSIREVARRAGVDVGTVSRIEQGQILSPRPDNLSAIAEVLSLPTADVFAAAGWVPDKELPTLRPYLRTKYRDMPEESIVELEQYFEELAKKHGLRGPRDHEDET